MTADPVLRRHLQHLALEGNSPNTIRHRGQAVGRLARALPVPVLAATPDMLYEWRAGLTGANVTVACYLSHVRSFFRWAVAEKLITENPVLAVPSPKLPRRLPRPIAEADLMYALSCATHEMPQRLMLVLGGWVGMRIGEIAGLRVENLRLHDTPPVVIISAESAKGSKERVVELSPFVMAELAAARLPLSGYVLTDAYGRPLDPKSASRMANDHLHGCGISSTIHKTRHRFATQLASATHDPQLVQNLLGHADLATTAAYMAFSRTGATAAVAALPVPGQELEEAS